MLWAAGRWMRHNSIHIISSSFTISIQYLRAYSHIIIPYSQKMNRLRMH